MEYCTVTLNRSNHKRSSLKFATDEQNDRPETTDPGVLNFVKK